MPGGGDFVGSHLLARMVGLGMSVTLIGPDIGETSLVLHTTRARSDLGFEPRDALPEGLKEEIGWFRATFRSDLKSAA